ncbi:hypothetical protein [Chromobacterium alticapitis]|uniref:hypothetical protein n=1 Tax=Chromobacterium alticapitis TaxID=2073169 RepID=UPI0011B0BB10|nr:hypothetical protein [Chromobacterium alticapitis]
MRVDPHGSPWTNGPGSSIPESPSNSVDWNTLGKDIASEVENFSGKIGGRPRFSVREGCVVALIDRKSWSVPYLFFRIRLNQNRIQVENKWMNLSPGMAATVEIKTGQRRVAKYFLSPLKEYAQESFRER